MLYFTIQRAPHNEVDSVSITNVENLLVEIDFISLNRNNEQINKSTFTRIKP